MFKYFRDYYWRGGKPYGIDVVNPLETSPSYKIIVDPYFKRFSVEKYCDNRFDKVVYDSLLLDFRHLTLINQTAWQREIIEEKEDQTVCLLRNQDDRAILLETLTFEKDQCRSCRMSSVHGLPLSEHRMYYNRLQDPFDGVVLYDLEGRPVMMKLYEVDPLTGEFTTLLKEEWDMQTPPSILQYA